MIGKLNRFLETIVSYLIGVGLLGLTLTLCFNVISRYGFGYALPWAEELTTYIIIWITFIGGGICVRRGLHVSVDAFVQFLPPGGRRIMKIMANLAGLAFSVVLVAVGYILIKKVGASGQVSPALMIPVKFAYMALPAGGAFMFLEYVDVLLSLIFSPQNQNKIQGDGLEEIISGHV